MTEGNKWLDVQCRLREQLPGVFCNKTKNLDDILEEFVSYNITVFSLDSIILSSDDLEDRSLHYSRLSKTLHQALLLRGCQTPTSVGSSILEIVHNTSNYLKSHATYFLLIEIPEHCSETCAHLVSFDSCSRVFRCFYEFQFTNSCIDYGRFVWGINRLVFQLSSLPTQCGLLLTSAFFSRYSSSFVRQIYLLIFLAFAYPFFDGIELLLSLFQIDISQDFFWGKVIHIVLERVSRLSFLSRRSDADILNEIDFLIHQLHVSANEYDCLILLEFLRNTNDMSKLYFSVILLHF